MNCQAQDISKYRFTLLRAISRNPADGSIDRGPDRGRGAALPRIASRVLDSGSKVENPAVASTD
jgi:hypothetical protein